jgi:4-alpha-glucanotransferase
VDSEGLRTLARELGVVPQYWGWDGQLKDVADATLLQVLDALGYPVHSDTDLEQVRTTRRDQEWERTLPPVVVMREDADYVVHVHVPAGHPVDLHAELEDGGMVPVPQIDDFTPDQRTASGLRGQASFRIPPNLPLGWHRLVSRTDEAESDCDLVVTPARLTAHENLGARRAMGVQAQIYSVRSQGSWGLGDLADARDLATTLAIRHGADFLLVNPLHAASPVPPVVPSPYLPETRRFTSALYVRPEDVYEYRLLKRKDRQAITEARKSVRDWNQCADRLERDDVLAAKNRALEVLFAAPRSPARQALLESYTRREGQGLADFALWCARTEAGDRVAEREADPAALAERVAFHTWVQWVLDEQLAAAQQAARDAGMRIGLMHDLAVGVLKDGADAWALAPVLAAGVGVGAPADVYNQQGQNWNQPPWNPRALAEAGYRPWRDMLRSLLRHAGALRIDHVLGLFRLWWIPEGNRASDGAYVTYDHEAMIGILALEAQRAGAIVVGEDLGTFEPWVRDYLSGRGILGTSILWFEFDHEGRPLSPTQYRRLCLASVNTHDLPPTAAYLDGEHVRLRSRLGLLERPLEEELAEDEAAQQRVLEILRSHGLLAEDGSVEDTVIALHRHLARSPSLLIGVSLVDCVGDQRIQNQPGTDQEYPNWRIPLTGPDGQVVTVEEVASDERTARLLGAVLDELRHR